MEAIAELFARAPGARMTMGEIAGRIGRRDLAGTLQDMVDKGFICRTGKGRFSSCETMGLSRGRLRVRANGSGVVIVRDGRIPVGADRLGGAIDGDVVLVRMIRGRRSSDAEGAVLSVVERTRTGVSGILRRAGGGWILDPVDPALPRGLKVGSTEGVRDLREGKVVWGELDPPSKRLSVRLAGILGDSLTPSVYIDSICRDFGFPDSFSAEALEEAGRSAAKPLSAEGRRDIRDQLVITIDPIDARDFDDAVSLTREGDDWLLGVHIADVAAYVPRGGAVDLEAERRGTSVYLPDRVLPMLPEALSNGACSLRPDEDKLTRSVFLRFDRNGRRTGFEVVPSIMRSSCRLNYEEALLGMKGGGSGHAAADRLLVEMARLSALLDRVRETRGALDLGSFEFKTLFGPDGWPERFERSSDDESHRMIENFMVEANRAVAEMCGWNSLPVLYRVHGEPDGDSAARLRTELSTLGLNLPKGRAPGSRDLSKVLDGARSLPVFPLAREAVLRSLRKAVYSGNDSGHFGLALKNYMHFTSPIRRYPDLIVHQVLGAMEAGGGTPSGETGDVDIRGMAENCSATEQAAEYAERDCLEIMALLCLSRDPSGEFGGVVSGVEEYGAFVRLLDLPVDGLAPARLHYNQQVELEKLAPGKPVVVGIHSVDPGLRQLTLKIIRIGGIDGGPEGQPLPQAGG